MLWHDNKYAALLLLGLIGVSAIVGLVVLFTSIQVPLGAAGVESVEPKEAATFAGKEAQSLSGRCRLYIQWAQMYKEFYAKASQE